MMEESEISEDEGDIIECNNGRGDKGMRQSEIARMRMIGWRVWIECWWERMEGVDRMME